MFGGGVILVYFLIKKAKYLHKDTNPELTG